MTMTSAWEKWNPFGGEAPPSDYGESLYLEENQQNNTKSHDSNQSINGTAASPPTSAISNGTNPSTPLENIHPNPWYRQTFTNYKVLEQPLYSDRKLRVIATGAGATGIQATYLIGQLMSNIDLVVYEKLSGVGGTWRLSKYPGCACDIPSHCYQFYWNRNPDWTSFYSPAGEILRYLEDTVDKFDLRGFFKFEHRVLDCEWDEQEAKWVCKIQRPDGTVFVDKADVLLNTSGPISILKWPKIDGLNNFKGKLMHTGAWDESYSLAEKKVAVIGSGSSSVQVVPAIQPTVGKLINFVRSPVWLTPGFSATYAGPGGANFQYSEEQKEHFRTDPQALETYIRLIEADLGSRITMQHEDSKVQKLARENMEQRMRQTIINDSIADHLVPNFGLGCRRLSPGDEYMRSFEKDNVQFVPSAVARLTPDGVVDATGTEYKVDVVICATGYDTGFSPVFPVKGRDGLTLERFMNGFPRSYNGIMTPFFPNFCYIPGPGSPGSHGGVFAIVEWQIRWVRKVLKKMQRELIKSIEPEADAATDHYYHQHSVMKRLVYSQPCASWYKNGRVVGPVCAQYPGSRLHWHEFLRKVRYEDFNIEYCFNNRYAYLGNGYTREDISGDKLTWYFDHLRWPKPVVQ